MGFRHHGGGMRFRAPRGYRHGRNGVGRGKVEKPGFLFLVVLIGLILILWLAQN